VFKGGGSATPNMVAKPYSTGHIAAVSAHFTTMRLSGAVKERLVSLLCDELDRLVPRMEDETLSQDPERKTLDDPRRSRLNYNRTRELMIDRISKVDSVGSAAVQAGIDHLEQHLAQLLRHASEAAERDRVATIKPRHLDRALHNTQPSEEDGEDDVVETGAAEDFVASQGAGLLTPTALLSMARSIAKMTVTKDALDELLYLYAEVLEDLEDDIRKHAQLGSNPVHFIESINAMKGMMTLGWMRSRLTRAANHARARDTKVIELQDIINSQSYTSE
jgi:histone H3/H4